MSYGQAPSNVPKRKWTFEIASIALILILAGNLAWLRVERAVQTVPAESAPSVPKAPISVVPSQLLGAQTAQIVLLVYSDFECPFCGKVARETLPALIRDYVNVGQVKIAFKHFPLPRHSLALGAATAAVCAGEQHKFWAMHDKLFVEPKKLTGPELRASAGQVGIDNHQFESCISSASAAKQVEADKAEARAFGMTSTPTFVFGRIGDDGRVLATDVLSGAQPIASFTTILDRLLKRSGDSNQPSK